MNVAQETLGFRRAGLSPALSLLMSAFALPIPPARVTPHLHRPTERSPTTPYAPLNALLPANCLCSAARPAYAAQPALLMQRSRLDFNGMHCRRSLFARRRQAR